MRIKIHQITKIHERSHEVGKGVRRAPKNDGSWIDAMDYLAGSVVDIDESGDIITNDNTTWTISKWMIERELTKESHPEYFL